MTNNLLKSEVSRRNVMAGVGAAGIALSAMGAKAQTAAPDPDIAILNYALTLEHLEATFYTQGLQRFSAEAFRTATVASVLGGGTVNGIYTNLGRIRDHEVAHVAAIQAAIRNLGGTPVEPCSYNFPYTDADSFLQVAATLEETGVAAYNGALAMIRSAALKQAAISITTVEGRHAAYLQLLNSSVPFPKAFDDAKMMREILALASQFITSCGTTPVGMSTTAILLPKSLTTYERLVQLDATQSVSGTGQPLTYQVTSVAGAAAVLNADTPRPQVQLSGGAGDYVFEVLVTDSVGTTSRDRVTIRYMGQ